MVDEELNHNALGILLQLLIELLTTVLRLLEEPALSAILPSPFSARLTLKSPTMHPGEDGYGEDSEFNFQNYEARRTPGHGQSAQWKGSSI